MKFSALAAMMVSAALATCALAQPGGKEPPNKAYPRQYLPGMEPAGVAPADGGSTEVGPKPGSVKFCRKELIDGLKECKDSFPHKEDRDLRDACTSALKDGYAICRGKAVPRVETTFDADWLSEGLIVVHAESFQNVNLYKIDAGGSASLVAVLSESPAWDGAYVYDDANVLMELGADVVYVAIAEPFFMNEDSDDSVALADLLAFE